MPGEPDDDATDLAGLVRACQASERDAFAGLYALYRDRVFTVALSYFRGDREAAEDVMQTVFVNLYHRIPQFRFESSFTSWLYRAVANACHDEFRRRRRFVPWSDVPIAVAAPDAADLHAEDSVLRAVSKLSPKLRMAVILKYYEDLSYDEMASVLECSPGTIASRLNRAHEALGRLLRDEFGPQAGGADA